MQQFDSDGTHLYKTHGMLYSSPFLYEPSIEIPNIEIFPEYSHLTLSNPQFSATEAIFQFPPAAKQASRVVGIPSGVSVSSIPSSPVSSPVKTARFFN